MKKVNIIKNNALLLFLINISRYSPSIMSVADLRVVVEENTNRSVGELEAQPVLVRIIDPLGDEERHDVFYSRWIARVIPLHFRHARL